MPSPRKKRMKIARNLKNTVIVKPEASDHNMKHKKAISEDEHNKAMRRKNFVTACEKVSCEAYFNRQIRLNLVSLPPCARGECKHSSKQAYARAISPYAENSFKIELDAGMWYDALEVCQMSITHNQYLSADVLKDIVEIMMNVHDDPYADYTVEDLVDKCQQVLELNFSMHPPCQDQNLRKCYKNFLKSPMDLKPNTFTNRKTFSSDHGIIEYCMKRLLDDMSEKCKDEPLINKYENIPDEMKEGVRGLHWEKEKFEIFELLERPDRIKRLMAVMESVIELLQFDLVIWQTRHTNKLGIHIMNVKNKPLIAFLLWSDNPLYTGAVTSTCFQIITLFINFIHLQYPEEHIRVITTWLNVMIEAFYICENKSNSDYPNLGKYCAAFANKFYTSMNNLTHESKIRVVERIQPHFMRHLIGIHVVNYFLSSKEDNHLLSREDHLLSSKDSVIKILSDFVENRKWDNHMWKNRNRELSEKGHRNRSFPKSMESSDILKYITEICRSHKTIVSHSANNNSLYAKMQPLEWPIKKSSLTLEHLVQILYVTFEAYLEAYSVQCVQDTLDTMNENSSKINTQILVQNSGGYSVSEEFIKKYRTIYQTLQQLIKVWLEIKQTNQLPDVFKVFENLSVLGM